MAPTTTTNGAALRVASLLGDDVADIAADATLHDVADRLVAGDIGALVVRDGGRVVAVVSERDLVRALAGRRDPAATPVIDVATRDIVWCDVDATVADVAAEMMDRYVRHVLVEDDGELVGVISARDLLGVYATTDD